MAGLDPAQQAIYVEMSVIMTEVTQLINQKKKNEKEPKYQAGCHVSRNFSLFTIIVGKEVLISVTNCPPQSNKTCSDTDVTLAGRSRHRYRGSSVSMRCSGALQQHRPGAGAHA